MVPFIENPIKYKLMHREREESFSMWLIQDGDREKQEEKTADWHEENLKSGDYVPYLDSFMVSHKIFSHVKIYLNAHFKYVQFILHYLDLDKAA